MVDTGTKLSTPVREEELPSEKASSASELTLVEHDGQNSAPDTQEGSSPGESTECASEIQDSVDAQLHVEEPIKEENPERVEDILRPKLTLFMLELRPLPGLSELRITDITSVCDDALAQPADYQLPNQVDVVLRDALMAHGQKLYAAVACDPAKWLNYAVLLRSEPIFTEAMIHLIGCWPVWRWPTKKTEIPRAILRIIEKKSIKLREHCRTTDHALFLSTITIATSNPKREEGAVEEFGPVRLKTDSDAWLVVAKWREWFSKQLRDIQDPLTHDVDPTQLGGIYRTIYARVDHLLPEHLIDEFNDPRVNFPHYDKEICENLTLYKESQAELVEDLVQNNLMLHLQNHPEVKHLTCAKIADHDIPWKESAIVKGSRKRTASDSSGSHSKRPKIA